MSNDSRMLDFVDVEDIGDGRYQPAPLRFRDREVAMKWGRAVADVKQMLDDGRIDGPEAERLWTRFTKQSVDEDTRRSTGIIVVRERHGLPKRRRSR